MDNDDLDRELRAHLEFEAEEQRERGLSAADAEFVARRALGNVMHIREDVRALSPWSAVADFIQDVRYGLRMLRRQSGFAIVAALTLALGIGATTAMYSVVDAVLVRPLPFVGADRLAVVWENINFPAYTNPQNTVANGNFHDWREQNRTFTDLAAVLKGAWSLTGAGDPASVPGEMTTASLFTALQVHPILGRIFTPEEDQASPSRVVLIGYGLWVGRFGSNPSIVGQTLRLGDEPYNIIGVMPRGFHFPDSDDQLWVPLGLGREEMLDHGHHVLRVVGRLKPEVTLAQAHADLDAISARLATLYPQTNTGVGVTIRSLRDQIVGDVRAPLLILLGAAGFVLLMVCANIGNLLLTRASAREREFAVRAAVGASRSRLVRQMLAESVLVAAIGGVMGLALAWWGVSALRWLAPANLPRLDDLAVNGRIAAFNFAVAVVAGVACGLMPAWRSRSDDLHHALKDENRGSAARAPLRARDALVAAETALAVVVLVGAGLLLRSFVQLTHVPVGFTSGHTLTFRSELPPARYRTNVERAAFYKRVIERLESLPGVRSAAAISFLPLTNPGRNIGLSIEGDSPGMPARFAEFRTVTPRYFAAMSIPLTAGRDFAWTETTETRRMVVVSQTLAHSFWPGADPLGKRVKTGLAGSDEPWFTVIGVVADVYQLDLKRAPRAAIYFAVPPTHGTTDTPRDWVIRTSGDGDPVSLASAVRTAVWSLDASLPVVRVQTMDDVRSSATASQQFNLLIAGLFAVLALVLAAVGVYGVTAYSVTQRTRELGIRAALGAGRGELLRLVLGHGARLAVGGLLAGTVVALGLTQFMSTLLFGVGVRDPLTFAGVCVLLLVISLAASLVPAYRATRADPIVALRT